MQFRASDEAVAECSAMRRTLQGVTLEHRAVSFNCNLNVVWKDPDIKEVCSHLALVYVPSCRADCTPVVFSSNWGALSDNVLGCCHASQVILEGM